MEKSEKGHGESYGGCFINTTTKADAPVDTLEEGKGQSIELSHLGLRELPQRLDIFVCF